MLHSIPYNLYDDGTVCIANELFCLNNNFEKSVSSMDLSIMAQRVLTLYEQLLKIQFSLNNEKETLFVEDFEKYQSNLNSAFKYYKLVDKKLSNARKIIINLSKNGNITSFKDAICFTDDDELIQ